MSTQARNISNIDGVNVPAPTNVGFTANSVANYPNDAAFEAAKTPGVGDLYFNTTENALREYNGTAWQYDKTIFGTQNDSTTTGTNQDITPGVMQIIRFTQGSLASIRSINPANQKLVVLINGQASLMNVVNESASATAANRINTGSGADIALQPGQALQLVYDSVGLRWRVTGGAGGSRNTVIVSGNVTTQAGGVYLVDSTAVRILTLPAPTLGASVIVKDKSGLADVNAITIARSGGGITIEGVAADWVINTPWTAHEFYSDGIGWFII